MVGRADRPKRIVHADVILTRSKINVKVTGLLNFRKLPKACVLAAMSVSPFGVFWFKLVFPDPTPIFKNQSK